MLGSLVWNVRLSNVRQDLYCSGEGMGLGQKWFLGVVRRAPGSQQPDARWAEALKVAREGQITNLTILTLDVVSAPCDGLDR